MISIFNGQSRTLGDGAKRDVYAQINVTMRQKLNQFKESSDFMVFMCIALHINSDGWAWPKLTTIALETGLSQATVSACIKRLHDTAIDGHRVMLAYRPRNKAGAFEAYRYLLMPSPAEVKEFETDQPASRKALAKKAKVMQAARTTPSPNEQGVGDPSPNEPALVEGGMADHYSSIKKEEPEEGKPINSPEGEVGGDSNQSTQALSTSGKEDHLGQMNRPAAPRPASRPAPTTDTQKGDDLVMNHLKRKAQANTLSNWDIDPANVEAALGGLKTFEQGKKINQAVKSIEFAVTETVGELGLRCWADRTYALHLLKMDVKLDELQAVAKADAEGRLAEFASLKGYGLKHAYQAMIIHRAAEAKGKAKQADPNRDVLMKSPQGQEFIVKGFQVEDALARGFKFVKGE